MNSISMMDIEEAIQADVVAYENDPIPLVSREGARRVEDTPEYSWLVRGRQYQRAGEHIAFLAQPYTLTTDDLRGILDFCNRHDLRCEISTRSEWEPGETLGVLFWKAELNPFVPAKLGL